MEPIAVLVVDRDESTRSELAEFVTTEFDAAVQTAESVAAGSEIIESSPPTVLVTGYEFPDGNGLELVALAREQNPGCGCILYTDSETVDTESFEDVIVDFVPKESANDREVLRGLIEQTGIEQTQAAHPVPEDEPERLDAAERLSGVETDSFERIVRLAADHFGVESAALVLVRRDEVEALTAVGPPRVPELREQSLSTHALLADEQVLAVEDTRTDPRFSEINAVQDAGIVSYLGATVPGEGEDGVAVLSVFGTEPRVFDADGRAYLGRLAAVAGDLIARDDGDDE
jgi:CheY-like chemotaxis protein